MIKKDLRNMDPKLKKTRSDKKSKVLITLSNEDHEKLKKLAISCDKTKTKLASEMVNMCVNHLDIIDFYQKKYNKDDNYRVIPIKQDGKTVY